LYGEFQPVYLIRSGHGRLGGCGVARSVVLSLRLGPLLVDYALRPLV
jgi:hypothetical protein